MNPWIKILRPVNGAMGVIGTFTSGFIGSGLHFVHFIFYIAVAAIAVFLVTSGGNIINDVVDVDTDRINHPDRPMVTGRITRRSAIAAVIVLFVGALIISAVLISLISASVVVLAEVFLMVYELRTKRLGLTGNVMISVLVGLIFIFGGIAVNSIRSMLILFAMATLANLSREIIKDIEDVKGDVDRITLPKKHGVTFAAYLAAASVVIAVIISYFPYYFGIFTAFYLIPVAVSDALFILSIVYIMKNPKNSQQISKTAMIVGLI